MDLDQLVTEYLHSDEVKEAVEKISQIDMSEIFRQDPYVRKSIDLTLESLEDAPDDIKADPLLYLEGYEALFDQYYTWIRATNPRWSTGGGRLMEWREAVSRYEALYGGKFKLLKRVGPDFYKYAVGVIPKDYLAFAGDKNHIIICALRPVPRNEASDQEYYKPEELVNKPVGGLSARLIPQEGGDVVVIEWLRVNEAFRHRGIAHSLMAELFCQLMETPFAGIGAFYDMFAGQVPAYTALFGAWSFEFNLAPWPFHELKLKDVRKFSAYLDLEGYDEDILPLRKLTGKDISSALTKLVSEVPGMYDAYLPMLARDYWDPDLSCAFVAGGKPKSFLFVHNDAFGRICLEGAIGDMDDLTSLVEYAAFTALETRAPSTVVRYRVSSDFSEYMQKKVVRGPEENTYICATMVQPLTDVTPEEFEYLVSHPDAIDFNEQRINEEKWTEAERNVKEEEFLGLDFEDMV